ncbi:MAG TPA: GlsB/YeaQ/YmgE family stress response membrane protein [Chloroflexota bacterium]|jgi:uncharacterized membrane protein YeaQ/YmgE (transglycosylase-associated protein family)|nr:GlsB/YeaQ/YmgE family stress response membrane protein [Chloroflexota bacterium]
MAYLALALLALVLFVAVGLWLAFLSVGLILKLALAGLIGGLADMAVPGKLPYGWLGAVIAGVIGGWVGSLLLPNWGPSLLGIELIPTFLGAVVVVGAYELLVGTRSQAP